MINKQDAPSCTSGFITCTKLEIILFLFHCRVIKQKQGHLLEAIFKEAEPPRGKKSAPNVLFI